MKNKWTTQTLIMTAMLAAVAGVLMSLEFALPMMPPFYKVDFSDVPTVIATFLFGPISGACVELLKILIKTILKGSTTFGVGELANLISVFIFVLPLWLVYDKAGKTMKAAKIACVANIPVRIAFSCFVNAFITLPLYAKAMGISLDEVVAIVGAVNPAIKDLKTFIILATIPFNLIKNSLNCLIAYLLYTRLKNRSLMEVTAGNAQKLS